MNTKSRPENFIPVNEPSLGSNELRYLTECIESGWVSSDGPFVARFEDALKSHVGREHAIAVSSGSAALDVAVTALGLEESDEVILPAHTIISCAQAISRTGASIVLVDTDPVTWNMAIDQIEAAITPRTAAIMVVHTFGLPTDMAQIKKIADKHKLRIIEDAAQAIGVSCHGKQCGSFGDISIFSFYPNKHITTGEGGMIFCDDSALAERCRSLKNLCFKSERRFVHDSIGWNYRMSNLNAAVGLAQYEKLPEHLAKKKRVGNLYRELLCDIREITLPPLDQDYAQNHYWVFGLLIDPDQDFNADAVRAKLGSQGIGTRPFFWPIHLQPVYQKLGYFQNEHYPIAEYFSEYGFYIPSGVTLRDDELKEIVEKIRVTLSS